jgi:two-component system, OmpR family, sensor kinase
MRFFQSIRWRVQLWHSVLLAVILSVLGILFYFHEQRGYFNDVDRELLSAIPELLPRFSYRGGGPRRPDQRPGRGSPQDFEQDAAAAQLDPDDRRDRGIIELFARDGLFFVVWDANGRLLIASEQAPQGIPMVTGIHHPDPPLIQTRNGNREVVDATPELACVIAGMNLDVLHARLARLGRNIIFGCSGIFLGGLAVGWWLTGRATRPFSTMRAVASRVAGGELQARVPVRAGNHDETSTLAHALNDTFARLEESFEELRSFTAEASHELRTPITAALAETQLALRKERTAEQYRETIQVAQQNLKQLGKLAETLLDLSRLDAAELVIELEEADLSELVKQSVEELSPIISAAQAKLALDCPPARVKCDPVRIRQVITNLVANAIQHSPAGVAINIKTLATNSAVELVVSDNGPGIAEADLPNIFKRFYRSAEARRESREGAGLGLAITHGIVTRHGGKIRVKSQRGQGTTFTVELPVK